MALGRGWLSLLALSRDPPTATHCWPHTAALSGRADGAPGAERRTSLQGHHGLKIRSTVAPWAPSAAVDPPVHWWPPPRVLLWVGGGAAVGGCWSIGAVPNGKKRLLNDLSPASHGAFAENRRTAQSAAQCENIVGYWDKTAPCNHKQLLSIGGPLHPPPPRRLAAVSTCGVKFQCRDLRCFSGPMRPPHARRIYARAAQNDGTGIKGSAKRAIESAPGDRSTGLQRGTQSGQKAIQVIGGGGGGVLE